MLADHIGIPQLREMASRSEQVSGEIGPKDLSRLSSLLYSDADHQRIDVQLSFHRGPQGFPEIAGKASGSIELRCQRCLGALDWPVELNFQLVVVESESDIDEIARPFDAVVAGEHGIDLAKLVEDELLGSLPLAPMHENFDGCRAPVFSEFCDVDVKQADADETSVLDSEAETHRPFAGLAAMMTGEAKAGDTD